MKSREIVNVAVIAAVLIVMFHGVATAQIDTAATGDLFTGSTWVGGSVPGVGDTAVILAPHTATTAGGTPNVFNADELQINGTLRTTHAGGTPLTVNDLVLNNGGTLYGFGPNTTKVIVDGTLTLNDGGILRSRNQNNRTLKIEADSVVGSGTITVNTEGNFIENSIDIDTPDISGFTGTFLIDGGSDNVEGFDIIQDIAPANSSFGLEIVESLFRLTGDVAVTSLIVDGDPALAPGTYNFGDLSGLGYGAFFSDEGGTITVAPAVSATVPEPASAAIWSLIGLALVGFCAYRRRMQ